MELFGYLDPGTGSVIIQAVVGAVLAISVVFRSFIGRAFGKLRSVFGNRKPAADDQKD